MENNQRNIILIGFMGSGKTCVGERLAKQLLSTFQDTDHLIEKRVGDTVSRVFEVKGEQYFRDLETDLLQSLLDDSHETVLSTGGGLPIREENRQLLKKLGVVIYLKASKETLIARLKGNLTRPLLQGEDLETKVNNLLEKREPIYKTVCDIQIVTDGKTIDQVVKEIMNRYYDYVY